MSQHLMTSIQYRMQMISIHNINPYFDATIRRIACAKYDVKGIASEEDRVNADLQNITLRQYLFNCWVDALEKTGDGFKTGFKTKPNGPLPVKLAWWKCWFWWAIPGFFLGVDDRMRFCGWKIGHCLNCDASPYDGTIEAWSYDGNWHRGALIRCNKCGQLRWQVGKIRSDY